jgi:hypothetical protein
MQGGHCVPLAEDVAFGADPYIASSSIAARTAFTSYEQAHRGRMDAAEESRGQGMSPQLQGSLSNATTQLQLWLPAVRQLVAAGADVMSQDRWGRTALSLLSGAMDRASEAAWGRTQQGQEIQRLLQDWLHVLAGGQTAATRGL